MFQHCPFARAVWHGSILDIRTSEINQRTTKQWITESITTSRVLGQDGMNFLQAPFTILWLIWNHRNLVLYQGKTPNPAEVVLTSQSLICSYKEAFQKNLHQPEAGARLKQSQTIDHQNWQAIIKVAAYGNRRSRRCGYAFEAITWGGINLFTGAASSGRWSILLANQEVVLEAMIKAKEAGLRRIIIMNNCRRTLQIHNNSRAPAWQEQTFVSDMRQLKQQGMLVNFVLVPKFIVSHVLELAIRTTSYRVHVYNLYANSI